MNPREKIRQFIEWNRDYFAYDPSWIDSNENYAVFLKFEVIAITLIALGRARHSAHAILEKIRYDSVLEDTDKIFKVSNNIAPDLARMFVVAHPEHAEFFSYNRDGHSFKTSVHMYSRNFINLKPNEQGSLI